MSKWLSSLVDRMSNYLAVRKGLLPLIGMMFILLNFLIQFLPVGWLGDSNLFLHLGILVAIFGLLLAGVL